jgi:tetratricopeptide (TPR) repeat protein
MLTGKLETMKGNLDAAIQGFMDASAADPKSALAHQMRAHLLTQRRRPDEAIGAYQTALSLTADPRLQLAINAQMVDQLMATKRFADAAATYDRIIALRPDLAQNPTIAKGMKKAKKQAGLA